MSDKTTDKIDKAAGTPATARQALPLQKLLTAEDLCELLSLEKHSLYREVLAGRIPAPIKLWVRRKRWHPDRVRAWLATL